MSRGRKEPLWRKVNTRTHGVRHGGGEARHDRNAKTSYRRDLGKVSGERQGRDYKPLFRFLIAKVGRPWDETFAEAVTRLDSEDPIWWLVAKSQEDETPVVTVGEGAHLSGLRISEDGILERVASCLKESDLNPPCSCCTHTFNGARLTQTHNPDAPFLREGAL